MDSSNKEMSTYDTVYLNWVAHEYAPKNKELVSIIKSLKYEKFIKIDLPRGKVIYTVIIRSSNIKDLNKIKNLINQVSLDPISIGLELDSYENPENYINNIKRLIENLILYEFRIPVTFIEVNRLVNPSNINSIILNFVPYSGNNRIYENVSFTLSELKEYRYLTSNLLINYLSPNLEDSEGNKIKITNFHDNDIYIIPSPMDLTPLEENRFQESLDDINVQLNNISYGGTFIIKRNIDNDDVLDLNILIDIAEMWGMKVKTKDMNGENLLRKNMIAITCSSKNGSNCKHLADIFPVQLSTYPKLTTLLKSKDVFSTYLPIDPSENIKEWFIRALNDIKDVALPLVDLYGEWQTYGLSDAPRIMGLAIKTYIELFPYYERISDIDISDDLGIHARFASIDEFVTYKEKFLIRLDNIHKIEAIPTTNWVEAILIRLYLNEPSLVVHFREKWYVVLGKRLSYTNLKEIKNKIRNEANILKEKILAQLSTNYDISHGFEVLLKELQNLYGKEALHGYHSFGVEDEQFTGHIKPKNMPYIKPIDGNIVVTSHEEPDAGPVQIVEVGLKSGDSKHLFTIATSKRDEVEKLSNILWNNGWLMSPFGSELMRTLRRMPSYFGSYGILKHSHESQKSGHESLTYLQELALSSKNSDTISIF